MNETGSKTSDKTSNKTSKPSFAIFLATAGGLGYLPKAPGTFGSLPGLALGAALHLLLMQWPAFSGATGPFQLSLLGIFAGLVVLAIASIIAWWTIKETEVAWNSHDDKRIVSDEVVGQALACFLFTPTITSLGLAFLFFRLFDIWKPSIIGWADRLPSSFGTLLDDLLAGLFALIATAVLLHFFY